MGGGAVGTPKNLSRSLPIITRDDLRRWVRAHLEEFVDDASYPPRASYALVGQKESVAMFLVALRKRGKDVLDAQAVMFALVQGTRNRVMLLKRSAVMERRGLSMDEWRSTLNATMSTMDIDASFIDKLSTRLGTVKLC
ncbi:MAG TPA: hypothetical protein VN397_01320 [Candidatus Methylomirabilis sp.]|nr:hypothetical protein [Candidatus Methylomirabilis sp.]